MNYKQYVLEAEVNKFKGNVFSIEEIYTEYKGRVIAKDRFDSCQETKKLIDFLEEMKSMGFEAKEVCDFIIEKYLTEEVSGTKEN